MPSATAAKDLSEQWRGEDLVFSRVQRREIRHEIIYWDRPKELWRPDDLWVAARVRYASLLLSESVEINRKVRGGVPVIRGTRIPLSRVLMELADDRSPSDLALPFPFPQQASAHAAAALTDFCLALFNSNEFIYID